MFTFWSFIWFLILGLFAGFIARILVPGRNHLGFWGTMLLGVIGSFVGGFLGYILFGYDKSQGAIQPAGVFGSIIGAIIVLLVWRAVDRRRARPFPHA